ncbi:SH2 domain-containing protein 5 isoform 2-T3 [Discoglossus pictus]
MRKKQGPLSGPGGRIITKFAEESDWRKRIWIIEEQMRFLQDCPRRRSVILKFCVQGVKMYDAMGETLLMAHALRRIQYTTYRSEDSQFAFVSRNPHGSSHQLFCHLFVGSQPCEAQVLNILLCRSFQLQYLALHPEVADPEVSVRGVPLKVQRKCAGGGVVRQPLDPDEVSQNVNALVSFRRLPGSGEDRPPDTQTEDSDGVSVGGNPSLVNSYCSPTLVRKKAIRSKVLRSGAYRCPNYEAQLHREVEEASKTDPLSHSMPLELSDRLDPLLDAVWFCAGIGRDSGITLLKDDRVGAFLLRADPGCVRQWTMFMRTQCGVIPYKIYKTQEGRYSFEHLPEDFASLTALVDHHTSADGCLFYQLAHGRVNPCYEDQESSILPQRHNGVCPESNSEIRHSGETTVIGGESTNGTVPALVSE